MEERIKVSDELSNEIKRLFEQVMNGLVATEAFFRKHEYDKQNTKLIKVAEIREKFLEVFNDETYFDL